MRNKSFTVVELLIVIAVIGLLSSIILVNLDLPAQRKKARMAKSLEFSQTIQNALGSEGVGTWTFDEGSGTAAKDYSGYGNDGVINGATYTGDTPYKIFNAGDNGYALSFDGAGDYIDAGNGASLNLTSITITAWLKPNGASLMAYILAKFDGGPQPTYYFYWDGIQNKVSIGTNGTAVGERFSKDSVFTDDNEWVFAAVTDDIYGNIKFYRNGVFAGEGVMADGSPGSLVPIGQNDKNLYIGSRNGGIGSFNGIIDEVHIYGKALSASEIQKHYAEGLLKHQNEAFSRR